MKEKNFTQGPIMGPLVAFVFPIMFAMLIQALYGAVDLLVVGQFSDAANVSAVAVGSQLMHTFTVVIMDLAMGATVLLGQHIGRQEQEKCGKVLGATIFFFAAFAIVLALVMQPLAVPAASALNAPEEAFSQTVAYIRICAGGTIFIAAYNVLGSVFRGIGDANLPLISVIIAAVFNVGGDLFFVAVLGMGAAGAAIATVMAQALSVLLCLLIIKKKGMPFRFSLKDIGAHPNVLKRMLRVGTPIALQDVLVSISFLIIMAIVNELGVVASAGVGVAEKLCGFIMLLPAAFSQAMSSVTAQNYGAGKMDRAEKALRFAVFVSLACNVVIFYVAFFHGTALASIFSKDASVCLAAADYLKGYGIDCLLTAVFFCFLGFFNGYSKTGFVMLQGIIGAFGVRLPLSIIFSRIRPVSIFRISLATPASSAVQIVLCLAFFFWCRKKYKSLRAGSGGGEVKA